LSLISVCKKKGVFTKYFNVCEIVLIVGKLLHRLLRGNDVKRNVN